MSKTSTQIKNEIDCKNVLENELRDKNNLLIISENVLEVTLKNRAISKKQVVKLRKAILSKQNCMFFILSFCNYCKKFYIFNFHIF